VGKHDRKDKDEEFQGDGFVGWIPGKPEPGEHATDDTDDEEDQSPDEDQNEGEQ
jgi:hypothetical protein